MPNSKTKTPPEENNQARGRSLEVTTPSQEQVQAEPTEKLIPPLGAIREGRTQGKPLPARLETDKQARGVTTTAETRMWTPPWEPEPAEGNCNVAGELRAARCGQPRKARTPPHCAIYLQEPGWVPAVNIRGRRGKGTSFDPSVLFLTRPDVKGNYFLRAQPNGV